MRSSGILVMTNNSVSEPVASPEGTFGLLNERIQEALKSFGVHQATEAQDKLIPEVLAGEDCLLLSPTGSGKTEAAMLPIFHLIMRDRPRPVSCIYVTPLRALNRDMLARLREYGEKLGIRIQVRHSDITAAQRREIVTKPGDVLITTPESLQIMLKGSRLREVISSTRFLIVDEIHELAQNERGSQFAVVVERLSKLTGGLQRIGLSATVGNPSELAAFLSPRKKAKVLKTGMRKSFKFNVGIPDEAPDELSEVMGCDSRYAGCVKRIWDLVSTHNGTLVFVNTRSNAEDLAFRLRSWKGEVPVAVHHGSLSKDSRESAERDFKGGRLKALICTSSLELGIDIGSADLVIQFNSPRQINKMLQRVGRSGHWIGKVSKGEIICADLVELEESASIVAQSLEGMLEPVRVKKLSLSTVANQVLLELSCTPIISMRDFYGTVRGAYPYNDLGEEEFVDTIGFLEQTRKVWIDGDKVRRRKGNLDYFISNISMIPSEKTYRVIDIQNKKFVGTLDERYVVSEIEPGSFFIIRGTTWRTSRIDDDRILVEPFPTAAITPKWKGEDIPVLPESMKKTSEIRKSGMVPDFVERSSADQLKDWYAGDLAFLDSPVIEAKNGEIIIQVLLGTRANFALAEILSGTISAMTGQSVEMDYSPYHIYLKTSRNLGAEDVRKILVSLQPDQLENYVKGICRRSRFFSGVFLYEARKFGVIANDADIGRMRLEKIVDSYADTVLFKDTVRKLIHDYMDLDTLRGFLSSIGNQEFRLRNEIGKSTRVFLRHYTERVMPLTPTKVILESIKKRILNETTTLYCTICHNQRTMRVREINSVKCPACGSGLVASLSQFESDQLRNLVPDSAESKAIMRRLYKNAHLIRERGMQAVIAMSARGIGPETALRILEISYQSEEDLIKAILNAEIEYAKNRRFWD